MFIEPGTYRGSLVGGAWNAWGGAVGNGMGWLNNWGASLPGGKQIFQGTGVYNTPIEAHNAANDIYFKVPKSGTAVFTNGDPKEYLADNVGGTSISITKSLGSASKDRWSFASDVAGYAASIATVVGALLSAAAAAPVGLTIGVMSTFIALGLAATSLSLLQLGGPLSSGYLISSLLSIKNLILDVVSASYLGVSVLSSAVKMSIFGLLATGVSIGAAWMASDPPNFHYEDIPTITVQRFNTGGHDDQFANLSMEVVDAWRVNMDSLEKYQGAVLAGNTHFADLQREAYENSTRLLQTDMALIRAEMTGITSSLGVGNIITSGDELLDYKNQFLSLDLPNYIDSALALMNVSEQTFKATALDQLANAPTRVSLEEITFYSDQGIGLPLASAQEITVRAVPEPPTLFLILLAFLIYFGFNGYRMSIGRSKQNL